MPIRDVAAQNASLNNDYGATKGPNAPASHVIALYDGDPNIPAAEGGGVELTGAAGYPARITWANNGTNWPAAADGTKTSALVDAGTSTAAWDTPATHWQLFDAADGTTGWDNGEFETELDITAAGTPIQFILTVLFDATARP